MRLFTGVFPPPPVQNYLGETIKPLEVEERIRIIPAGQIHVTLNFLDRVEEDKVDLLETSARSVCSDQSGFELTIASGGFLPTRSRPRVIYVGIGGERSQLVGLQKRLETTLLTAGFKPKTGRRYLPHLTLARLRGDLPENKKRQVEGLLEDYAEPELTFKVRKVSLVRSDLSEAGARYEVLHQFPLGR